jgi:hypothetical protein
MNEDTLKFFLAWTLLGALAVCVEFGGGLRCGYSKRKSRAVMRRVALAGPAGWLCLLASFALPLVVDPKLPAAPRPS